MARVEVVEKINIDNTRFIFSRNLAGDPAKSKWHSSARIVSIIIPDENLARHMSEIGLDVRQTKPREGEEEFFTPEFYVQVEVKYRNIEGREVSKDFKPQVFLVTGNEEPTLLDEESIGILDNIRVKNVNVTINASTKTNDTPGLKAYVKYMYVEQNVDEDPWREMYASRLAN